MSSASTSVSSQEPPNPFLVAADIFDPPAHPYVADPVGYARDVLGFPAWSKQAEIMRAVRDHPRVAVRSSHGPGKTATAAQVVLWFLRVFRNARIITTAPTWAQVEQLLWREIRAGVARASRDEFPKPSATKLELGVEWFAIGLSTNEPERFQGHHAEHLLLVVDEASGVDERIYEAAEGFLTAEGAHILLVGNPTKLGGQFHRAFTTERTEWHTIHISTEDTPNYTGEPVSPEVARAMPRASWMAERAKAWGVGSPMYQVRVKGNFPSQAANTVIPLHLVEEATRRDIPHDGQQRDKVTVSCDVARYGDDETVIAIRTGMHVEIVEHWIAVPEGEQPTTYTARRVMHHAQQYPQPAVTVVIDDAGLGGGVTDIIRDTWARDPFWRASGVIAFNGAEKAYDQGPGGYPNRRSELWFGLLDALPDLDLPADEQLMADLSSPVYRIDEQSRRVVEKKDDTKKRLGRSPDRADAVLMTLVAAPVATVPDPREQYSPNPVAHGLPAIESGRTNGSLTGDLLDTNW